MASISIPYSYDHATKHEYWKEAIKEELQALIANKTWETMSCRPKVKLIGCKWVYSVKLHSDGTLDRCKARLVVLGNRQEFGIDYEETFAPIA